MLKFYVKVFRTSLFSNPMMDLVYIWYDDKYWSKILFNTIPTPMHDLKVKSQARTFMLTFYIKVFRTSFFPNPLMDLVHIWCDDKYWSKILFNTIPTPMHDLKVKSQARTFMITFYVKVFRTSLFPNPIMDLVHVWCDDRYWSKILHSTIPTPIHNFKVKVTDLELLCKSF